MNEIHDVSKVINCKHNKQSVKSFPLLALYVHFPRFQLWLSPKAPDTVNSCHFSIRWLLLKHGDGGGKLAYFFLNVARIPAQEIHP